MFFVFYKVNIRYLFSIRISCPFFVDFRAFIFYFIYYFLSFSERWVRPTSYQPFCRCSWWSCMLLLVIRLWRTSLHTLAKHQHPRQNECKKKGSVVKKSLFSLSFVSLTHHCTQTSSRPTPNLLGIVLETRLVPSILLGGFLLIVRAISFAIHSRVDNKLSETVRFAIKYFHPLRIPSARNASAKSGVCKVARDFPANRKAKRSNKRSD